MARALIRAAYGKRPDRSFIAGTTNGGRHAVFAAAHHVARDRHPAQVDPGFPFDPGIAQTNWADWKLRNSVRTARNPVSVGFIFSAPPSTDLAMATDASHTPAFALAFDFEAEVPKIFATNSTDTESGMSFMTPPNPTRRDTLRNRGGRMIVARGSADAIFSLDDTIA